MTHKATSTLARLFLGAIMSLGLLFALGVIFAIYSALTIVDPYLIQPSSSSIAPSTAQPSHSIDPHTHILSVVSAQDVMVVADPGQSFKYEVLWLAERPRKDGSASLRIYQYKIPKYAADHIHPLGSAIPPEIQRVADGSIWH